MTRHGKHSVLPANMPVLGAFEIKNLNLQRMNNIRDRLASGVQRHLVWIFIAASLAAAVPATISHFKLQDLLESQTATAHVVNIAGRQRMLTQKIAFLSTRYVDERGDDAPRVRLRLIAAIDLFEASHNALIAGAADQNLPGLKSEQLRSMYLGPPYNLDLRVAAFIRAARNVARKDASGTDAQAQGLEEINHTAEPLLDALDEAVHAFDRLGTIAINRIERAEWRLWGAELAILAGVLLAVLCPVAGLLNRRTSLLKESETRFREAANMARLGYFNWQGDFQGAVKYSDEFRRVVQGAIRNTLDHTDYREWIVAHMSPSDRYQYNTLLEDSMKSGLSYSMEFRLVSDDGTVHYFAEHGAALERLSSGGYKWFGTLQDVTARRLAQEELADKERQLRLMMENVPGALVYTDADMDIVFCSSQLAKIYNVPAYLLEPGAHYPSFFMHLAQNGYYGPGRITDLLKVRIESLRNPSAEPLEDHTPDGRTYSVRRQVVQGGGVVTIVSDVTDLNDARVAALEAATAKSEFLASMSHEIRTPMTGILGFADILLDSDLREDEREMIEKMKLATMSLLTIINDILDLSKIEAGKLQIETIDIELRPLLDGAIELVEERAIAQGLSLRHTVSERVPRGISTDPTRLRQVLINILGNAVKFTHEGHVALTVDIEPAPNGESDAVTFSIDDSGIGIAEDTVERLFEDFTQADASISRKYEGSGLGLSISKKLVNIMGGDITVKSTVGQGSTFSFWIPFVPATSDTFALDSDRNIAGFTTARPIKVLVAEDNVLNQRIVAAILEKYGHKYVVVDNGAAAVSMVAHEAFDLILMDVRMPEMSGTDATRAIRRMTGPVKDIPIIALTADAMPDHVERYMEAGMTAFVAKPIDQMLLLSTINRAMGEEIHVEISTPQVAAGMTERPVARDPARAEAIASFLESIKHNNDQGVT